MYLYNVYAEKAHSASPDLTLDPQWLANVALAPYNLRLRCSSRVAVPKFCCQLTQVVLLNGCSVHLVSEKNCANFFLSELRQIFTNFGNF